MSKIELDHIGTDSFQSIGRYNTNIDKIEEAFENTLSRDGTGPNMMEADLDMNSNRVYNLPLPLNASEAASKAYVDGVAQSIIDNGGGGGGGGPGGGNLDYVQADEELEARVTSQITAIVTDTEALASRVDTVEASFNGIETNVSALVSTEATARASADSALASRLDIVEASVESPNTLLAATVASHTTAIADLTNNTASASSVTTLTARVDDLEDDLDAAVASVSSEASVRAAADTALASRVSSVEASLGSPSSEFVTRIENVEQAVVDLNAGKASTSSVSSLTSTVNTKVRTFSQNSAPTATATGDLWIETDNNNKLWRWSGSAWVAADDARVPSIQASVTTQSSAIATINSAAAFWETKVAASGSEPAVVALKAGASGSELSLAARVIRLINNTGGTTYEVMKAVGGLIFFMNPISIDGGGKRLTLGPGHGVTGSKVVLWFGPDTLAPTAQSRTNGYFALGTDGVIYKGNQTLDNAIAGSSGLQIKRTSGTRVKVGFSAGTLNTGPLVFAASGGSGSGYTYSHELVNLSGGALTLTSSSGTTTAVSGSGSPAETRQYLILTTATDSAGNTVQMTTGGALIWEA